MTCFALASRRTVLSKGAFVDFDKLDTSEFNGLDSDFQRLWSICGELHLRQTSYGRCNGERKERRVSERYEITPYYLSIRYYAASSKVV